MTRYADIIARLEKATDSNRELDAAIFCASNAGYTLGKNQLGGTLISKDGFRWRVDEIVPLYTASIDASIALVERMLPGELIQIRIKPGSTHVQIFSHPLHRGLDPFGRSSTAPIAILLSLFRALREKEVRALEAKEETP